MGTHRIVIARIEHTGRHPRLGEDQTLPADLVLRYGFCDFENDGSYNAANEQIIESAFVFSPPARVQDWKYDSEEDTFVQA